MNNYAFSIDLGGTSTNFSVFKSDEIISEWTLPTPKNHMTEMLEAEIKNKLSELNLKNTDFKAIVIGIAGIVKNGIVHKAINLNLSDCDIGSVLESRVNIKVIVLNDVNLQAIGESLNYSSLFLVAIGTGIGAGLVINNHLVEGHNGKAGEIEFLCLDSKTIGEIASARGLVKTAESYLKSNDVYSSLRNFKSLTAKDIFNDAKAGDEVALKIINDVYFKLGKLLGIISSAFDPEVIIISGGVSNAGDFLLEIIKKGFNEVAFTDTEIRISEMKEKASVFGAMKILRISQNNWSN
ncbi:ROK family protein [Methanobrevibacter sp.]|uniref:ROK family protein n=1 Tax=Methanobrevibacter sp. TaxID=66852 RepID=UPI003890D5EC